MQIYRVVVRGQFADLDAKARNRLLANATEHHFLRSAFTAAGSLTYDEQLIAFNMRFEVRDASDEMTVEMIEQAAIERTIDSMNEIGCECKKLRASTTNMASMWH